MNKNKAFDERGRVFGGDAVWSFVGRARAFVDIRGGNCPFFRGELDLRAMSGSDRC